MGSLPETSTGERLLAIREEHRVINEALAAVLTMQSPGALDIIAPLGECWQDLPGRERVRVYHVPNPNGEPGLFLGVFLATPGAHFEGSHIAESRLFTLLAGGITLDERPIGPGGFAWIAPHAPTTWSSEPGALGVVHYHAPNPLLKP